MADRQTNRSPKHFSTMLKKFKNALTGQSIVVITEGSSFMNLEVRDLVVKNISRALIS